MSRCTVPDRQVQLTLLGISMSQLETDLRLSKIQKVEVLRHLETLPTVPAMSHGDIGRPSADLVIWLNVINVTEHSSLPSLRTPFAKWLLLSSPCRMGISHGALWNVMLSTQLSNQQLWSTPFCLSRALQRKMSRCTVPDRQVQPALDSRKADSWRSSERKWMTMTLLRTCYLDWSHSR